MDVRSTGGVGFEALSANPLRTALSTLGVVIGVGALVAVLALGDGVEQFSRDQLSQTTDLHAVSVTPQTGRWVDGVFVQFTDSVRFTRAALDTLMRRVPPNTTGRRRASVGTILPSARGPLGVLIEGVEGQHGLRASRGFAQAMEVEVGDTVSLGALRIVVHAIDERAGPAQIALGMDDLMASGLFGNRLMALELVAAHIEDVPDVVRGVEGWLAERHGPAWSDAVRVVSNTRRVDQAVRAVLIFKILMGAVTGITLLVGGIGIMNVLLASVTERTREIGIRRAAGARRRDVLLQFLTESVSVTLAGGAVGIVLGYGVGAAVAAVMRRLAEAPVHIVLTWTTPTLALAAAALVGLVFGLYPASRAARLSPVDAMRHE